MMRYLALITGVFIGIVPIASAQESVSCGIPSFRPLRVADGDSAPEPLLTGDLNGDAHLDLVASQDVPSYEMVVRLGVGDGTFGDGVSYPLAQHPTDAELADVDGDGDLDVVVLTSPNILDVKLNAGDGTFDASQTTVIPPLLQINSIAVSDFTSDGLPDVAFRRTSTFRIGVVAGDGAGGFGSVILSPPLSAPPDGVGIADLNGDGRNDLAVITSGFGFPAPATLEILLGTGAGTFVISDVLSGAGMSLREIADFTNDGRPDVLVTTPGPIFTSYVDAHVYQVTPAGLVTGPTTTLQVPSIVGSTGDFDADGNRDLLVSQSLDSSFVPQPESVLLGDGNGGFDAPIILHGAHGVGAETSRAVGDFDEDGRLDVAVAYAGYRTFLNTCGNTADLSVTIEEAVDPAVGPGAATYRVRITNNGPHITSADLELTFSATVLTFTQPADGDPCAIAGTSTDGTFSCTNLVMEPSGEGSSLSLDVVVRTGDSPSIAAHARALAGVVDPNPTNDSAGETTDVVVVGSSGLEISSAGATGVSLSWSAAGAQAGFYVVRLDNGTTTVFPSSGGPLPAAQGAFTDPAPVSGAFNCYIVYPVDAAGSPLGRSQMLCIQPGTASAAGAPMFTLGMGYSFGEFAEVTWSTPEPNRIAIFKRPFSGGTVERYLPDGSTGSTTFSIHDATGTVPTCFIGYAYVVTSGSTTVVGNSDLVCAVPNFGTIF